MEGNRAVAGYGAASPHPQGQIESHVGQLEIEANRHDNLTRRVEMILERLRGIPGNPTPPGLLGGATKTIEVVKPISSRLSICCDRFGGGNNRLDTLVSELDGLI